MTRIKPPILLIGLASLVGSCAPVPPPPACAQPEVLLLVRERLMQAGRGQLIEPGSVNQVPGETPDRLRCAARVETAGYNTNRFGAAPVITVGIVRYALELRKNGVFLLPAAPGDMPATDPGR